MYIYYYRVYTRHAPRPVLLGGVREWDDRYNLEKKYSVKTGGRGSTNTSEGAGVSEGSYPLLTSEICL